MVTWNINDVLLLSDYGIYLMKRYIYIYIYIYLYICSICSCFLYVYRYDEVYDEVYFLWNINLVWALSYCCIFFMTIYMFMFCKIVVLCSLQKRIITQKNSYWKWFTPSLLIKSKHKFKRYICFFLMMLLYKSFPFHV